MIKNVKPGKIYKVANKNKYKSANAFYNLLVVENEDGITELLLSDSDLKRGYKRAESNQEDIPAYTLLTDNNWMLPFGGFFVGVVSLFLGYMLGSINLF